MKELLYIDCCLRGEESRTAQVGKAFLEALAPQKFRVTVLNPEKEELRPLAGKFFFDRQDLLAEGKLDHPRFRYAHQFAEADVVVFAAPLWDLSFPAYLKIYVENVSVDGITFGCNAQGIYGKCKGEHLIFLTTRGGFYEGTPAEQGSRYLEALKDFFGFGAYTCIAGDGLDADGTEPAVILAEACQKARELARSL
ncbi:MAG: flavodoxin [Oscillospiraceae bacterium]|nr:flavodoxin [Oscillospiraceae bacterium]